MSAIVGIYHRHGQSVSRDDIDRMLARLSHCGPDDKGVWCHERVGLGHRMLHTTPESLHEKLPLFDPTANVVITADARIDNRQELIDTLGLSRCPKSEIADSELVLAAYERWGELCVEKLLGDFAFVIWDGRKQQLFCARDPFGVKPFYYYLSGKLFTFATEVKALFCLREVPRRLNETRVGDYLTSLFEDKEITFFEDIFRLPPAHTLTVQRERVQMRQYWTPDPTREVRRSSDAEYAEEFCSIFTEAVRCRLRSAFPVGSMLSGGLDSSSVSCVARNLLMENGNDLLHTFSGLFESIPECDERVYIEAVLRTGGFKPHYLQADRVSPFADFDSLLWYLDEANHRPNITLQRSIYNQAEKEGVRIMLDGLGGDAVVSHGLGYLSEVVQNRRWAEFSEQVEGLASHFNWDRGALLRKHLIPYLSEAKERRQWATLASAFIQIPFHIKYPLPRFYLDYGLRPLGRKLRRRFLGPPSDGKGSVRPYPSMISSCFAESISLEDRSRQMRASQSNELKTERWSHYLHLCSGKTPLALEEFGRAAAPSRVEVRFPHYDIRLAEFCLGLPSEQKLWQGWSRMILRRAMNQIFPEEIQWRGGKADLFVPFERTLRNYGQEYLEEAILRTPSSVEKYFDLSVLRRRYQRYISGTVSEAKTIWAAASLIWWLQKAGFIPVKLDEPQASAAVKLATSLTNV